MALCESIPPKSERVMPTYPPWPWFMWFEGKCVENRGTSFKSTQTCLAELFVYIGETKTVDPKYRKHPRAQISVAPDLPSGVVLVGRVVAVVDYSNPEHLEVVQRFPQTRQWATPEGKKTGIVFSHMARLKQPFAYKAQQGIHFLPQDTQPAAAAFHDSEVVQVLDDDAIEAFTQLHQKALQDREASRKRRKRACNTCK